MLRNIQPDTRFNGLYFVRTEAPSLSPFLTLKWVLLRTNQGLIASLFSRAYVSLKRALMSLGHDFNLVPAFVTLVQRNGKTKISTRILLSKTYYPRGPRFPVPLDKGNQGSGNAIDTILGEFVFLGFSGWGCGVKKGMIVKLVNIGELYDNSHITTGHSCPKK